MSDYIKTVDLGGLVRIDFDTGEYSPTYDGLIQLGNAAYLNGELSYVDLRLLGHGIVMLVRNDSGQLHGELSAAIERFIGYIRSCQHCDPIP